MVSPQISAVVQKPKRIRIGGCPVDTLSFDEAVSELVRRIETRTPTHVAFVNIFKVTAIRKDPKLRAAVERADLLFADGMPIVWASRLLGSKLPGRVTGVDLMQSMLAVANERRYRVYLLGATQETVTKTASLLTDRYPNLQLAGVRNGYFSDEEEPEVVDAINRTGADLVFLGMSTPKKEIWADRNRPRLSVPVCQGVGGSFDVLAGLTRRAPQAMQNVGLEWLYRLLQEPRRLWRRYLHSGLVFAALVSADLGRSWLQRLRKSKSKPGDSDSKGDFSCAA